MDDFKRSRKLSSSLGLFDGRESMYNTATSTRALRGKLSARLALFAVLAFLIAEGFTGHFFPTEDFVNGVEDFPGLNSFPQPQSPPPSSMSMGWRQRGRRVEKAGPTKLISATVKELETHQETVIYLPGLAQPCWDQPVSSQLGARFPTVRWVSLEAPARTVSVHNASELAWFDLKAFPVTAGDENTAQIYESARLIQSAIVAERSELIRTLRKRGGLEALPRGQRVRILRGSNTVDVGDGLIGTKAEREWASSRIVLAGFSQGAVMALYTALTLEDRLAGVVVLSGFLPLRTQIASLVADADRSNLPLFWGHGIDDPFLLFADAVSSVAQLQATTTSAGKRIGLGLTDVEFHSYPNVEHTWFPLEYVHVGDYLERVFQSHRPSKKAQSPQPQQ